MTFFSEENLRSKLNPEQLEAVTYGDGPLLVLAGAGSGKTRVLTFRYAYLVAERGVDPGNILAITFTNKAAGEMKTRISGLLGCGVDRAWIGTFHACCGRILRYHGELLGYKPNYTVYGDSESLSAVKEALKRLNIDDKHFPPKQIRACIEDYKDKLIWPEQALSEAAAYDEKIHARCYREYQELLRMANSMDFDDMILNVVRLLRDDSEILAYYRSKFRYILVDEYQDTNRAQFELINLLAGPEGNLCVVGDDDQSIYSFRGADVLNILNFEDAHPGTKIVKLEQNYRSTSRILDVANDIIRRNSDRRDKKLWTARSGGDPVVYYQAADHNSEASFIAAEISRAVDRGDMNYSDFAVLYRMNALSNPIENCFTRARIPYRVYGGMKFYDRKEIRDLVAYLRLLMNPADEASLRRIINVPKRGIGDATVENISLLARENSVTMLNIIGRAGEFPTLSRMKDKLTRFYVMYMKLEKRLTENGNLTDYVRDVINETGIADEYAVEKTPEADSKVENINEFLSVTKTYEQGTDTEFDSPSQIFGEFLESVSLSSDMDIDARGEQTDAVTLTTVHSAKGLEYPTVFVAGLDEGIFPSYQSFDTGSLSEERRLCYVAVTRAREHLFLSGCSSRMLYGKTQPYMPSRFLRDISEDHYEVRGDTADRSGRYSGFDRSSAFRGQRSSFDRSTHYGNRSGTVPVSGANGGSYFQNTSKHPRTYYFGTEEKEPEKKSGAAQALARAGVNGSEEYLKKVEKGQRVKHKKFGTGTVSSVNRDGNFDVVEISFDTAGMKRLVLEFAKLTDAQET